MLETLLFYLISFGVIVSAVGVISARSAVYSVLCLVCAMCMIAGLFVLLKAFLVATVLVLVYAGAILVLFLFVVMLIDFRKLSFDWEGFKLSPLMAILLGLVFYKLFAQVIQTVPSYPYPPSTVQGTTESIGVILFSRYALAFELTSFLLLAAVVSVVVLAKKDTKQ
jgi:NADH-quinone oxidoreductase subunit J